MQLFSLRGPPGTTPFPPPVTPCGVATTSSSAFMRCTRIRSPVKCRTLQWKWRRQPLRMSSKWLLPPFLSQSFLLAWCSPRAATWDWQAVSPALMKGEQLWRFYVAFSSLSMYCWVARMRSVVLVCFLGVLNHSSHKLPCRLDWESLVQQFKQSAVLQVLFCWWIASNVTPILALMSVLFQHLMSANAV